MAIKILVSKFYQDFDSWHPKHFGIVPGQRFYVHESQIQENEILLDLYTKFDKSLFFVYDDLESCNLEQFNLRIKFQEIAKAASIFVFPYNHGHPTGWVSMSIEYPKVGDFKKHMFDILDIPDQSYYELNQQMTHFMYQYALQNKKLMIIDLDKENRHLNRCTPYVFRNFSQGLSQYFLNYINSGDKWGYFNTNGFIDALLEYQET